MSSLSGNFQRHLGNIDNRGLDDVLRSLELPRTRRIRPSLFAGSPQPGSGLGIDPQGLGEDVCLFPADRVSGQVPPLVSTVLMDYPQILPARWLATAHTAWVWVRPRSTIKRR